MNAVPTQVTEPTLTLRYPELGTGPVPTDLYYKPEIYQQELAAIFKRTWIWVGRVDEVESRCGKALSSSVRASIPDNR